jgi:hypothetical protein
LKPTIIILVVIFVSAILLKWLAPSVLQNSIYWLLVLMLILAYSEKVLLWKKTKCIVTDLRVVYEVHGHFLSKNVYETPLERILNVSYSIKGPAGSVFKFGDVSVQIVGLTKPLILSQISKPEQFQAFLWDLHLTRSGNISDYRLESIGELQKKHGY